MEVVEFQQVLLPAILRPYRMRRTQKRLIQIILTLIQLRLVPVRGIQLHHLVQWIRRQRQRLLARNNLLQLGQKRNKNKESSFQYENLTLFDSNYFFV